MPEYGNSLYTAPDTPPDEVRDLLAHNYAQEREKHPEYGLTGNWEFVDGGVQATLHYLPEGWWQRLIRFVLRHPRPEGVVLHHYFGWYEDVSSTPTKEAAR